MKIDGGHYHCDPTWDGHGEWVGPHYFGMTDQERGDSGVVNFELSYDLAYGEFTCDRELFSAFRGVTDFHFADDAHRLILDCAGETRIYDTQTKQLVD